MRDAMGMEYDRSLRIARTEINRSYRLANAEQYRRSGVVEKVLRLCYKPTACFACLMLDGEECPNGVCDDHPNGKCTTIVTTTGGITPEWQKGSEWLEEQSPEDQRRIMGAGRYELWKNEGVDPRSMVWMKPNPVWGGSPSVKTFDMMGVESPLKSKSFTEKEPEGEKNARKNQPTSVNWDYVNSPEYHEKFQGLTGNPDADETIYQKSLDILAHRQNTDMEDMYLINIKTGKVVGTQTHSEREKTVTYNDSLNKAVDKYRGDLVSIHNHPNSSPPSAHDFGANYKKGYRFGIIPAHDGTIYVYKNNLGEKFPFLEWDFIDTHYVGIEREKRLNELTERTGIQWKKL